jgi:hypothetical protein
LLDPRTGAAEVDVIYQVITPTFYQDDVTNRALFGCSVSKSMGLITS